MLTILPRGLLLFHPRILLDIDALLDETWRVLLRAHGVAATHLQVVWQDKLRHAGLAADEAGLCLRPGQEARVHPSARGCRHRRHPESSAAIQRGGDSRLHVQEVLSILFLVLVLFVFDKVLLVAHPPRHEVHQGAAYERIWERIRVNWRHSVKTVQRGIGLLLRSHAAETFS